jgi:hypothetical protein
MIVPIFDCLAVNRANGNALAQEISDKLPPNEATGASNEDRHGHPYPNAHAISSDGDTLPVMGCQFPSITPCFTFTMLNVDVKIVIIVERFSNSWVPSMTRIVHGPSGASKS